MSNVVSHSKSKKRIELQNSAGSYSKLCFKKPGDIVNENVSDLQNFKKPLLSTQAEIRWVLKSSVFTINVQVMPSLERVISVNVW